MVQFNHYTKLIVMQGIAGLVKAQLRARKIEFKNKTKNVEFEMEFRSNIGPTGSVLTSEEYTLTSYYLDWNADFFLGNVEITVDGKKMTYKGDLLTDDYVRPGSNVTRFETEMFSFGKLAEHIGEGPVEAQDYRSALLFILEGDSIIHGPHIYPKYTPIGSYAIRQSSGTKTMNLWISSQDQMSDIVVDANYDIGDPIYFLDFIEQNEQTVFTPLDLVHIIYTEKANGTDVVKTSLSAKSYLGSLYWAALNDAFADKPERFSELINNADVSNHFLAVSKAIMDWSKNDQGVHIPMQIVNGKWKNPSLELLFDEIVSLTKCDTRLNMFKLFEVRNGNAFIAGRMSGGKISTSPGRRFFKEEAGTGGVACAMLAIASAAANEADASTTPKILTKLLSLLAVSLNSDLLVECEDGKENATMKGRGGKATNAYMVDNLVGTAEFTPYSLDSGDGKYLGINRGNTIGGSGDGSYKLNDIPEGSYLVIRDGNHAFSAVVFKGVMSIINDTYRNILRGQTILLTEMEKKRWSFSKVDVDIAFDQGYNLIVQRGDGSSHVLTSNQYNLLPGGKKYV